MLRETQASGRNSRLLQWLKPNHGTKGNVLVDASLITAEQWNVQPVQGGCTLRLYNEVLGNDWQTEESYLRSHMGELQVQCNGRHAKNGSKVSVYLSTAAKTNTAK